jgi:chromosome segregation ATPase
MVAGEDAPETSALVALSSSPPAKVAVAAAATEESRGTIASDEHLTRIQAELETTKRRLAEKELEADKLGSDLREATGRILRLQEQASAAEVASADEAARRLAANPHAPHALSSAQMQEWEQLAATLQEQVGDLERQLREANEEISSYQARIRDADKRAAEDREELARQVAAYRAEAGALRQEIQDATLRNDTRGASDASHYKERAKLQAELAAHRRRIEQLESEKQELEADVEDLTLDKDQLEKEREALENRVEELNFDVENAQLEVEELKVQLEDAREASERAVGASSESSEQYPGAVGGADAEDVIRAQKVQIERLRSALLMQREQLAHEKRELDRQLRDAEKDAEAGRAASGELESLKTLKARMEEEVNELKDRVEESAAFESMVEEMSDRVLAIEDENIGLRSTIRELEEAAELTAEMEELQADELKALNRDLEGRDTIIRNLEEVIKM